MASTTAGTLWNSKLKTSSGEVKSTAGILHGMIITFASSTTSYIDIQNGKTYADYGSSVVESSLVWSSSGTQSPYYVPLGDIYCDTGIYVVLGGSVQVTVLYQ